MSLLAILKARKLAKSLLGEDVPLSPRKRRKMKRRNRKGFLRRFKK